MPKRNGGCGRPGCDSPAFDAVCLLEDVGGLPRGTSPRLNARTVPADKERAVRDAAGGAGRPAAASVYSGKLGVPDADTLGGGRGADSPAGHRAALRGSGGPAAPGARRGRSAGARFVRGQRLRGAGPMQPVSGGSGDGGGAVRRGVRLSEGEHGPVSGVSRVAHPGRCAGGRGAVRRRLSGRVWPTRRISRRRSCPP